MPAEPADRLEAFLKSEDLGFQGIDLSNPTASFLLLQAKAGKGGGGTASVQGPEDPSFEFAVSRDEEINDDVELPRGPHKCPIYAINAGSRCKGRTRYVKSANLCGRVVGLCQSAC